MNCEQMVLNSKKWFTLNNLDRSRLYRTKPVSEIYDFDKEISNLCACKSKRNRFSNYCNKCVFNS